MLKKWIDEIREKTDLYKTDSWKYQLSGNVIELSVMPVYMKNKDSYRCAVIAIGQVLKALTQQIEKSNSQFHIQSFPSIENPSIVASLRIDSSSLNVKKSGSMNTQKIDSSDPESFVLSLAKQNELDLLETEECSLKIFADFHKAGLKSCFALYSTYNNPFTWLKVGYWKESVESEFQNRSQILDYKISDLCGDIAIDQSGLQIPKNRYLQSVIGFSAVVSTPK